MSLKSLYDVSWSSRHLTAFPTPRSSHTGLSTVLQTQQGPPTLRHCFARAMPSPWHAVSQITTWLISSSLSLFLNVSFLVRPSRPPQIMLQPAPHPILPKPLLVSSFSLFYSNLSPPNILYNLLIYFVIYLLLPLQGNSTDHYLFGSPCTANA